MITRKPEKLNDCLLKFKRSWSDFDNLIILSDNWSEVVGVDLAKECKPLKIEKNILTIVANHPQWRQALIYNKNKLKESILKLNIKLKNIRIVQNYPDDLNKNKTSDTDLVWNNHPSRIKNQQILSCRNCNNPTPAREIERWGKCIFCWRKSL